MTFRTPIRDMRFLLEHAAHFEEVRDTGAFEDLSGDLLDAVMEEIGKFATNVIAPLNRTADTDGAKLKDGAVTTSPGFKEAYAQYVEAGWNGLAFPEEWGGQGMPQTLALMTAEAMFSACLGFSMGLTLTTGAVKALMAHGTEEQRKIFLPKMVNGEWAGTMNLTEPQAGSDLSGVRTKATPRGDGTYQIEGSKIYISYGEHDMTENICHLVLARLPDAPEGTRGISMFLVPKFRVNPDGSLGERNDVKCTGIEHKLGQHGSPTCSLTFGDTGDCLGTLVGKEHEGLKNMFVMMNAARVDVGISGIAIAERAFQQALEFAGERRQGREPGVRTGAMVPIIEHPDVRRMLMTMKSLTDAGRAIAYANMVAYDVAHHSPDEAKAAAAKEREELLTPISKAFGSDRGMEAANIGIQVHGGMGFVEETGAAQHFRDVRITAIYEGTNGIQAIDLAGRKLGMGQGKLAYDFLDEAEALVTTLKAQSHDDLTAIADRLATEVTALRETTQFMVAAMASDPDSALAGATPYLDQFGYVAGGFYLARAAQAAAGMSDGEDGAYYAAKLASARFYADNILPRAGALAAAVTAGAKAVAPLKPDLMSA